ncbi:MAG: YggS family pyridoxal phosphate-dependent enzyme [Prochlorococcus sp.]|nr:YggS family pyridoxal phosphate-dependent enzyme [Prochlorococcaceae cyanobacterium ETNP2_MAG_10]MDP6203607.1 YggS family pyridoxal phosphate-dependent enzyme [Prochlorococcaceae cyanobacterium ETNP18_MAG_14]MDP6309889.1 YggS family pyridoxal phosphate-dependent enzyme [Prochlorococcaceae cyanobacterium ETNP14_MAG_4]HJM80118.1 YggS family pyridoxal phosphate-dependent enzyme [Prochlorococcaceae cyanobacterium Fu_MAG_72]
MTLSVRWRDLVDSLPVGVHLLAVSKGHPAALIRQLAELGQQDFGESRLQEALPKLEALADLKVLRWHFIGRLQANKVRAVVRSFAVIHSVDSQPLAERISRIAAEENCCPEVLLQVKLRDDPTKGGFSLEQLKQAWPELVQLPHLKIIGLMTMAPLALDLEQRQELFRDCRDLADQLDLSDCSMGMSGDWPVAIKAGATWLRLGSILFGARISATRSSVDEINTV